jgi:hypothetical protein
MRAAIPHPAIPIRSSDVIMMPKIRLATPALAQPTNREFPDDSDALGSTGNLRFNPSNMTAARQEFIRACQDLIFISFAGPRSLRETPFLFHRPPAASAARFPRLIAMPACHRDAIIGALDVSPSQGLWWRNGSIATTVGVA